MFSHFFIDRPRFALVISIVITLVGLLALQRLPVAQFPSITPPVVQVNAVYPGASAEVVEATVATPIESKVNGVDDMLYISSKSANDGTMSMNVTFEIGTDPDMATVNVQNRVSQAQSQLPEEVVRQGVVVRKKSTDMLLVVNLISPNETFDSLFLSNYALINVRDALVRVDGVGDVAVFGGADYGMRIWLDADKMAKLGLTTGDIAQAVREQNLQAPAGQVGQAPIMLEQQFQYSVVTHGRLDTPEEFAEIVLRARPDGTILRLGDVARIELGAESYANSGYLSGSPSALIAVYQLPGANALDVADAVTREMERLSQRFPEHIEHVIVYDTTLFVRASIREVVITLLQALVLVILVVFVFLGDWRSTLVPSIAIPVSLIGTFSLLLALGFTLNTITLFALILAAGIVVDDAIVVVEGVRRWMEEGELSAREAARRTMTEVTSPIIVTTLVLLAVFVPVAFIPGIVGQLYKQFAVTISFAVSISSLVALTLSPALCAALLRPARERVGRSLRPLALFESGLARTRQGYRWLVGRWTRRLAAPLLVYAVLLAGAWSLYEVLPAGFLPNEDQGGFLIDVRLPDGAALPRTEAVTRGLNTRLVEEPGVKAVLTVPGFSMLAGAAASNAAMVIVVLDDWPLRDDPALGQTAILNRIRPSLWEIEDANVMAFSPPPIRGLGVAGGFELQVQDRVGGSPTDLMESLLTLIEAANRDPHLQNVYTTFRPSVPRIFLDLDRNQAKVQGIPISQIFQTLQAQLGSLYVNDFNKFGRVYKVQIQAEPEFRASPSDIGRLFVRNQDGEMIPLSSVSSVRKDFGPEVLNRFNLFRSALVTGSASPGRSSGQAIADIEQLARELLPDGMGFEWTGTSYQEIRAGTQTGLIFALAVLFAYLFLVAQYESWTIPVAVMLSVPISIAGGLLALWLAGLESNVYAQIGLVMLVGLASKTAILIVEFARSRREAGLGIVEAAVDAARVRFRAVLMTTISFVLGVTPLVLADGAGSLSRRALGTVVFGGMLLSTLIGTLLVPVFYVLVQRIREKGGRPAGSEPSGA